MRQRRDSSSLPSDRVLGCLLGGILGMLLTLCLAIGVLLLLPDDESTTSGAVAAPPPTYDVEAVIAENYVNRMFLENTARLPQPVPLRAGHIDIRPGALADFAVQTEVGPLRPVFRGTVRFHATEAGELRVTLEEVRVGRLPVTSLVPDQMLEDVNEDVNRQLQERAGAAEVQLTGVTSDDTTLHFYLISAR